MLVRAVSLFTEFGPRAVALALGLSHSRARERATLLDLECALAVSLARSKTLPLARVLSVALVQSETTRKNGLLSNFRFTQIDTRCRSPVDTVCTRHSVPTDQ